MSPSDLGQALKPFVFLDIFDMDQADLHAMVVGGGMPIHPHSGIATVTVLTQGRLDYDDPDAGCGTIGYGGVEWMSAGGGVWHGKEMSPPADVTRVQGFQLWLALPRDVENAKPQSRYIEVEGMQAAGPAHVILGVHLGVASPVPAPAGVNYLLVTLRAGECWNYQPPEGHTVGWLALASGAAVAGVAVCAGDMVLFENGEGVISVQASDDEGAVLVLGSAVPHPYELHLGCYSVHTSEQALTKGENRIRELERQLKDEGDRRTKSGTVPIFG
ncbi:pirin family protein [Pseudomonas sp. MAFF 301350]|uniref:Pirin family protein n=2 Tax=Pseudomonas aegrilactucae TaxID=2854028 RepID=A0A9Q2XQX4_9PSED|nr:pirin family protein [Pseudomonas aegrilactucae]MBV6290201.1 pirin family protein [Pseudomonas aegrilactucae]